MDFANLFMDREPPADPFLRLECSRHRPARKFSISLCVVGFCLCYIHGYYLDICAFGGGSFLVAPSAEDLFLVAPLAERSFLVGGRSMPRLLFVDLKDFFLH